MALDESEKAIQDDGWGKQHDKLAELVDRLTAMPWPRDTYKWARADVWRWLMYSMGRLDADERAGIDNNPKDLLYPYAKDLAEIRQRGGGIAEFKRARFKWKRLRRIPVNFIRVLGIYEDPDALGRDMAALGWVPNARNRNVWFVDDAGAKRTDRKAKTGIPSYAYERNDGRTVRSLAMTGIDSPTASAGVRFPAAGKSEEGEAQKEGN